jgi:hypothetical protein
MRKNCERGVRRQSLISLVTMRSLTSASGFCAVGALVFGCTVYDSALIQSNGGLTGNGNTGATDDEGGSTSSGGKTVSAGAGGMSAVAGMGGSDVIPSEGGAADGGEGTAGNAGSAGSAAMGGSANGGSGGTGMSGNGGVAGKGGSGGSGGGTPAPSCADHPLTLKTTWVPTASSESLGNGMESDGLYNPVKHMTDGNYTERWSSGATQAGDEWIQIDFGDVVNLTGITLNVRGSEGDYPREYVVRMSNKAKDFAAPALAMGSGLPTAADPDNTVIPFTKMATGRYLTVRQTGVNTTSTAWWTISEFSAVCGAL